VENEDFLKNIIVVASAPLSHRWKHLKWGGFDSAQPPVEAFEMGWLRLRSATGGNI
jgi:hypothetical protein